MRQSEIVKEGGEQLMPDNRLAHHRWTGTDWHFGQGWGRMGRGEWGGCEQGRGGNQENEFSWHWGCPQSLAMLASHPHRDSYFGKLCVFTDRKHQLFFAPLGSKIICVCLCGVNF